MLRQRLVFGALMIAAVVGIVLLDGWMSAQTPASPSVDTGRIAFHGRQASGLPVTLLVLGLAILSVYELARLCQAGGYRPAAHWAACVSALLIIAPWVEMQQKLATSELWTGSLPSLLPLTVFLLTGGALGAFLVVLGRKTTDGAVGAMATTLLLITYLGLLSSFVVRIRCCLPGPGGAALVVFFILTVKSGDIGAFFTGKFFGKHKLAPWLSPGKTIEGAFGALIFSSLVSCGLILLWGCWAGLLGRAPIAWTQALVFGALMAICGHLGDLVESAIKRDCGSKDSGRVIPAFGGLLDILDSPVFTAPIAWWLLTFWGRID